LSKQVSEFIHNIEPAMQFPVGYDSFDFEEKFGPPRFQYYFISMEKGQAKGLTDFPQISTQK